MIKNVAGGNRHCMPGKQAKNQPVFTRPHVDLELNV